MLSVEVSLFRGLPSVAPLPFDCDDYFSPLSLSQDHVMRRKSKQQKKDREEEAAKKVFLEEGMGYVKSGHYEKGLHCLTQVSTSFYNINFLFQKLAKHKRVLNSLKH